MRKPLISAALSALLLHACQGERPAPPPAVAATFVDAVRGALLYNPEVNADARLRLEVEGDAAALEVALDERLLELRKEQGQTFAVLPADLDDGVYTLRAPGDEVELVVSRVGAQITFFDEVGAAATPRLHRLDERMILTWADRREGDRRAFLAELDGAARVVGEPVALTPGDVEALAARVALANDRACVLYQTAGGPYTNHLLVTDLDGRPLVGPLDLDPDDRFGSFGGAVAHDGAGCVAVFRTNDGGSSGARARGELRYVRVDDDGAVSAPRVIAESGDPARDEGFDPVTFISVVAGPEGATVAFTRKEHDPGLQLSVPAARFLTLDGAGELIDVETARRPGEYRWFHEARALDTDAGTLKVWTQADLTDPDPNPPVRVVAGLDAPRLLVDAPGHRGEVAAAGRYLAWLDERSLVEGLVGAKIELTLQPLSASLDDPDAERVVPHATFIAGTSELGGVEAGPGAYLVWLDQRHGDGLFDPRPEVWIEAIWD